MHVDKKTALAYAYALQLVLQPSCLPTSPRQEQTGGDVLGLLAAQCYLLLLPPPPPLRKAAALPVLLPVRGRRRYSPWRCFSL